MKIKILSLFTNSFSALDTSIIARAKRSGLLDIEIIDIRPFSSDKKHFKCDDAPFGGGAGMVMSVQPIYDCIKKIDPNREYHRIYLSAKGKTLNAKLSEQIAQDHEKLLLLCGHYEGIDQRAIDLCIDEEISIGNYILTGGELAAMVLVDTVARFIPMVLGNEQSNKDESFSVARELEYPHYTRPQEFMGLKVPEILLSGNHAQIAKWRTEQKR